MLSRDGVVNEAGTWEEGYRSYLGRSAVTLVTPVSGIVRFR